ncbi:CsbD family protein [Parvularcula maris]|uniref:CsbD family protein n=1 Tax=Parvularcula maris TaxID=2965077 RepID=A0A9X2L9B9_9PROT|nr:CsbD family protein [Parvularcula maris]MCQ8185323.1 CsbD family protein [Parvularcula maris]
MAHQTSTETKAEGSADQLGGQIKETVGAATGDESLERQGENDQRKGSLKKAWGNVKDAFSKK